MKNFLKIVTILILIDGFLQSYRYNSARHRTNVTILILIDGFLQWECGFKFYEFSANVTILILIDGFLQY